MQSVQIPADSFAAVAPAVPAPPQQAAQAFGCPGCGGQFGVTPEMNGQTVACPHCQAPTLIQLGAIPGLPDSPVAEPEEISPIIETDKPISRKRKKSLRKIAKSKDRSRVNADLFSPLHQPKQSPKQSPEQAAPVGPTTPPVDPSSDLLAPPNTSTAPENPAATSSETAPVVPKLRAAEPPSTQQQAAKAKVPTPTDASAVTDQPPVQVDSTTDTVVNGSPTQRSIAHLLPPVFDVLDPTRMAVGRTNENFKVFLPDGKGGTAQIDNRILRVKHGEREVSLVSLTDEQRARQRLIQNIIAIVVGIAVIALAFTLLM